MRETEVKRPILLALTCSAAAAVSGAGGAPSGEFGPTHLHRAVHRHARAVVAQEALAPGEGDTDGLGANIDDCNKGCIGGQPG